MPVAVGAYDLNPTAISIQKTFHSPFNLIIKTWPTAVGIKLIFRSVQWCVTLLAMVGARGFVVCVFSSEGAFGTLVDDDAFFFRG
jgi:hypothetical protein